jgi:hypothetical protein
MVERQEAAEALADRSSVRVRASIAESETMPLRYATELKGSAGIARRHSAHSPHDLILLLGHAHPRTVVLINPSVSAAALGPLDSRPADRFRLVRSGGHIDNFINVIHLTLRCA